MLLAMVLAGAYVLIYRDLFAGERMFSHDSLVWFGTFHYYIENIKNGVFPYWDPYSLTGTPFYQNISGYGLLDPTVLLCALVSKITNLSTLTLFIYFRLCRIFLFVIGAFFLFRHLSRNCVVSVLSAGILLFTVTIQNNHQPMMDLCFSLPYALFLILRLLDTIETPKRYLPLFGLTLVVGVTMNIYIPSLFLLNVVFFVILVFALGLYDVKKVVKVFLKREMLWCTGACLLLATMMASPPLVVSLLDTTKDGELFAISKMVDSNDGKFKAMMASDFGGDLFFDKIRKDMAGFISYGSVLNLLTPDVSGLRYRPPGDTAYVPQLYMGIVPVMLIMIGMVYVRTRLQYVVLAMAGLVFFAAFSFGGGHYNVVQKIMNAVFPPLRMLDMRLNFSSALSFYLCTLFCLTAAELVRHDFIPDLVKTRFRSLLLLMLAPMVAKILINVALHGHIFLSGYDTTIMLAPFLMTAGIVGVRHKIISGKHLVVALLILSILDLSYAGIKAADTIAFTKSFEQFLNEKEEYRRFSREDLLRSYQGFEYFRIPFVPIEISPLPAFVETMVQTKGAIISNSDISIFTTKRYYDIFSLMPLEQQLAMTGVMYPVVRFFPLDQAVFGKDAREVFDFLRSADARILGPRLYLEREHFRQRTVKNIDFTELKDVTWFGHGYIDVLFWKNAEYIKTLRINLDGLLNTELYRVHVDRFSTNDIAISVENGVGGYLLYNDGWSKYWKAYDHGRELPIVVANYNSKAVFLQPGKHQVRFVFSPSLYKTALVLYYAGLVLSSAIIAVLWRREKQKNAGGGEKRGKS